MKDYNKEEQVHNDKIRSLCEEWNEKGKSILTPDKWSEWERIVPFRLADLYHGRELGDCLDIISILNNNGSLDEAKSKIESQRHSGMSFSLVCSMVRAFCNRGKEFVDYVNL